jgi:aspartate/methionine/tyrosine aminotransferase
MFLGLQRAAIEAFKNTDAWHSERNKTYAVRRNKIFKILDLLGFEYSTKQVGLFVWAKPKDPTLTDIPAFVDKLLYETFVFFTPGEIFGEKGKGYMRASLCVPENKIDEATVRIEQWLNKKA